MHFPITDSHLHLWDNKTLDYPRLERMPMLNRTYLLSDLMDATKSLHIESFLFVQSECDPGQSIAEVNWVNDLAKRDSRIQGIVAYAPLELGNEVRSHLEVLKSLPHVKGVRRMLLNEQDDFCLQPTFIEGIQMLAEFNFSFDICVNPQQLPAAIKLVEQCPQIKFVLDHLGKPNIVNEQLSIWQTCISELAAFPNVWCKISGLVTEAHHQAWRSEDLKPYLFHAIEEFTYDRVMFGSDWPMINLASSYAHWVHTLYDLLIHHQAAEEDLKKLFHKNAQHFYELHSATVEISQE